MGNIDVMCIHNWLLFLMLEAALIYVHAFGFILEPHIRGTDVLVLRVIYYWSLCIYLFILNSWVEVELM